jgi:hypothetical protein
MLGLCGAHNRAVTAQLAPMTLQVKSDHRFAATVVIAAGATGSPSPVIAFEIARARESAAAESPLPHRCRSRNPIGPVRI